MPQQENLTLLISNCQQGIISLVSINRRGYCVSHENITMLLALAYLTPMQMSGFICPLFGDVNVTILILKPFGTWEMCCWCIALIALLRHLSDENQHLLNILNRDWRLRGKRKQNKNLPPLLLYFRSQGTHPLTWLRGRPIFHLTRKKKVVAAMCANWPFRAQRGHITHK